ncbi:MAG: hypothetical protein SFW66_10990 [Gammaproteobacteria bacterium]|nr:hypothetical protein [Gammaproteobacteria bacterium]
MTDKLEYFQYDVDRFFAAIKNQNMQKALAHAIQIFDHAITNSTSINGDEIADRLVTTYKNMIQNLQEDPEILLQAVQKFSEFAPSTGERGYKSVAISLALMSILQEKIDLKTDKININEANPNYFSADRNTLFTPKDEQASKRIKIDEKDLDIPRPIKK